MRVRVWGEVLLKLALTCGLLAASAGIAQEIAPAYTYTRDVAEARLWFLAHDRAGAQVMGLAPSQVSVLDNGILVQRPVRLSQETDAPVRVHFVIDVSGSDVHALDMVHRALSQFVAAHSRPGDLVLATAFSGQSVSAHLRSAEDVAAFWAKSASVMGRPVTAIYDNLFPILGDTTGCDAVLLISDGADNWSVYHSLPEVLAATQRATARVFALDIGRGSPAASREVLARIAEAGGGRMVSARPLPDADAALSGMAQDLRTYYTVSFAIGEEQRDGRFHAVALRIGDARVAHIQMKPGYFAPVARPSFTADAR